MLFLFGFSVAFCNNTFLSLSEILSKNSSIGFEIIQYKTDHCTAGEIHAAESFVSIQLHLLHQQDRSTISDWQLIAKFPFTSLDVRIPPLIPAAKFLPVAPRITTLPPVMYSQPWSPSFNNNICTTVAHTRNAHLLSTNETNYWWHHKMQRYTNDDIIFRHKRGLFGRDTQSTHLHHQCPFQNNPIGILPNSNAWHHWYCWMHQSFARLFH